MSAHRAPPSYLDLFRTKEMRMITILITILWMLIRLSLDGKYLLKFVKNTSSLEFDCTVRNITNLDFSIYVSFCVSSCTFKETSINSFMGCRYRLLLSSLLICSLLWDLSGWEEGQNFQLMKERNQTLVFQVVSCPFHVGCWSDHLAMRLAYRPSHASGNLCHGWEILCHLRHEHWISVLS